MSDEAKRHLGNLLARIHRDGGHYEEEHGTEKAVKDADHIVAQLYTDVEYYKKELTDLQGDDDAWRRTYERTHADLIKADAEIQRLREALRPLDLAVRVSLAFQRPTAEGNAHLLDVERVETGDDLVGYLRVALDRARVLLQGNEP